MSVIVRLCRECDRAEEIEIDERDWRAPITQWICPSCEWAEYLNICERDGGYNEQYNELS